jgi:hypothetical protein
METVGYLKFEIDLALFRSFFIFWYFIVRIVINIFSFSPTRFLRLPSPAKPMAQYFYDVYMI